MSNKSSTKATEPSVEAPTPKASPKAAPKPKGPPMLPVSDLAKATGRVLVLKVPLPARRVASAEHAAASTLHGWAVHKHHAGAEMRLTAEDYELAIKAAKSPPRGQQSLVAHPPAVSPHCPHAFAQEK